MNDTSTMDTNDVLTREKWEQQQSRKLLALGKNCFLSRSFGLFVSCFRMFAPVLLLVFPGVDHGPLELLCLFDRLGYVPLLLDLCHITYTTPLAAKVLGVFPVGHLSSTEQAQLLARFGLPDTQISIVRSTQHEPSIHGERGRKDALHTLGVVDIA